jgi:hypothetical protein
MTSVPTYDEIVQGFASTGLSVRGGFACGSEAVGVEAGGGDVGSIVLLGNVGGSMWAAFMAGRQDEPDPLDRWTRRVVNPIADRLGASALFPNDKPYRPFQRWAQRSETVHASPLGLLIHPVHGLWHAYRAALAFNGTVRGLPAPTVARSPCETCVGKPCLSACPVYAFNGTSYDVGTCANHLRSGHEPQCLSLGCRARDACPVGTASRYPEAQIRFHMAAFYRSRGAP